MNEYIEHEAVCKDCIHCEVCDYWGKEVYPNDCEYNVGEPCKYFKRVTDMAPVVHGHWIVQDSSFTRFQCSVCLSKNHSTRWPYCCLCGAKMDEEATNES